MIDRNFYVYLTITKKYLYYLIMFILNAMFLIEISSLSITLFVKDVDVLLRTLNLLLGGWLILVV